MYSLKKRDKSLNMEIRRSENVPVDYTRELKSVQNESKDETLDDFFHAPNLISTST